jgi:FlaA1/EpsC-like NDP-sugar epimerase
VNPRNIMGATKRLAESYCQALDLQNAKSVAPATRFLTVRFGNVLGSTGSVVPLFQKQLSEGGPLTVTHPDITRYFMTVREAVQLILLASGFGLREAADLGKIFVLDMGEPIRIADLARQMIRLAGKRPDIDVKIDFIGLRPGEKLYEELLHSREQLVESSQKGLLIAMPRSTELTLLRRDIDALAAAAARGDDAAILAGIAHCVPEYRPAEAVELPRAAANERNT